MFWHNSTRQERDQDSLNAPVSQCVVKDKSAGGACGPLQQGIYQGIHPFLHLYMISSACQPELHPADRTATFSYAAQETFMHASMLMKVERGIPTQNNRCARTATMSQTCSDVAVVLTCSSSCQSTSSGTSNFSSWKPLTRRLKDCGALRRSVTVTSYSWCSRLDALSTPAAAQPHHTQDPAARRRC